MNNPVLYLAVNPINQILDQSEHSPEHLPGLLSPRELSTYRSLRFPKRAREWLSARLLLKATLRTIATSTGTDSRIGWSKDLRSIECPADDLGKPQLAYANISQPYSISISHRDPYVAIAIRNDAIPFGIDLERIEPKNEAFYNDYFTAAEQEQFRNGTGRREDLACTFWSAKESIIKALGTGLRTDVRTIHIRPHSDEFEGNEYEYGLGNFTNKEEPDYYIYRIPLQHQCICTIATPADRLPIRIQRINPFSSA